MKYVRKRDGRLAKFDENKISNAIKKAAKAVGNQDPSVNRVISGEVLVELQHRFGIDGVPTVEEIQDNVEKKIIEKGLADMAKAYILYRKQHQDLREMAERLSYDALIEQYLGLEDWRVRENSNMSWSLQGLNNYVSSTIIAKYWLSRIYPPEIEKAHKSGALHIHDLGVLGPYCVGWDLADLLLSGFKGATGKTESKPAKHFRSALGQIVNFFYTLQGEAAGAQAFSNFDTFLAPFVRYDGLSEKEVVQAMQEFLFNLNVPTRVGFQAPFTNLTMDVKVPNFMKEEPVIIGGKVTGDTYGDFQHEVDLINKAYAEVMIEGDARGRIFTFPIVTYNITDDWDWDSPVAEKIFEMTAKYGAPYFSNFINSDMNPDDVRSMCCRLRIDNRELRKRGGGFFGANPLTGSIGVVTINLPRIGYNAVNEEDFLEKIGELMELAKNSLEIKRKAINGLTERGLYPYSRFYLRGVKEGLGSYWANHFGTIGIIGMNEALMNFRGHDITSPEGQAFAVKVLEFMRRRLSDFQEETGHMYNLEATPAEGTTYRLAKMDKSLYPEIIVGNESKLSSGASPFYTNSTHVPVDHELDLFEILENQDHLQTLYTGGTVLHIFLGERAPSWRSAASLVKKVAETSRLPYFTLTPTFSVCPSHGYVSGGHQTCPQCDAVCEVYSRVVGYFRPVDQWNDAKQSEFRIRNTFEHVLKVEA